ncbi:MAG: MaoC family dehydratase N-terminal domain-containing protein [Actinomycetota bacterium]|nr:MaoC family dehydratase N-terminal domain-containing protein [Actinomycetota bacterium]
MTESANGVPAAKANTPDDELETVTPGRTITEADLVSFAALTGDWHPAHTDAEWAARGRFGARIAHGMLVLSYAVGLFPFDPERVLALRGLDSISFKRPVHIGDTIRVASRVEQRRELDAEHELVTLAWRILNQEDRLVARIKVQALWRSRADVSEPSAPPSIPPDSLGELYGERLSL